MHQAKAQNYILDADACFFFLTRLLLPAVKATAETDVSRGRVARENAAEGTQPHTVVLSLFSSFPSISKSVQRQKVSLAPLELKPGHREKLCISVFHTSETS